MRLLVETTGDFGLVYAEQNEHVRHEGLTVIEKSQWASERISAGQLLLKGEVNDDATDDAWLDTVKESDGKADLALSSFLAEFPVDKESAARPQPAPQAPTTGQTRHNDKVARGEKPGGPEK